MYSQGLCVCKSILGLSDPLELNLHGCQSEEGSWAEFLWDLAGTQILPEIQHWVCANAVSSKPSGIRRGTKSKIEVELVKRIRCPALSTYNYTCRSWGFISLLTRNYRSDRGRGTTWSHLYFIEIIIELMWRMDWKNRDRIDVEKSVALIEERND